MMRDAMSHAFSSHRPERVVVVGEGLRQVFCVKSTSAGWMDGVRREEDEQGGVLRERMGFFAFFEMHMKLELCLEVQKCTFDVEIEGMEHMRCPNTAPCVCAHDMCRTQNREFERSFL